MDSEPVFDSPKRKQQGDESPPTKKQHLDEDELPTPKKTDFSSFVDLSSKVRVTDNKDRKELDIYRVYPVQEPALTWIKDNNCNVPIFAHDKKNTTNKGSKTYIVGSYRKVYDQIVSKLKHYCISWDLPAYYEIMTERYSHVFMDLEYEFAPNATVQPLEVLKNFINTFIEFLTEIGILNEKRTYELLTLHSKSDTKISFHVHIIGVGWVLANHYHVGALVRNFVMWTMEKWTDMNKHPFFFKATQKPLQFFADLAIYTNHRPFRLQYCAKDCGAGNRTPMLKLSEWKQLGADTKEYYQIRPDYESFLKSNPLYVENGKYCLVKVRNPDGSEPTSTSFTNFFRNGGSMSGGSKGLFIKQGEASSPLVQVCLDMIMDIINREAHVYFVTHDAPEKNIVIGTYSKRCPIKERRTGNPMHQSNHVHYVVYYTRGFIKVKCKDEDCINDRPVIQHISQHWNKTLSENMDSDDYGVNDQELFNALNNILKEIQEKNAT